MLIAASTSDRALAALASSARAVAATPVASSATSNPTGPTRASFVRARIESTVRSTARIVARGLARCKAAGPAADLRRRAASRGSKRVQRRRMELRKVRKFKGAGIELNCVDYGGEGRPPMLLVHGGAAHARWWDFVAPALTGRFHVMALDQRGHGDSPWTREWAYGTRHYIADLHQIISAWEFGPPILVGHSMGGHNVLVYAGTYSETVRAIAAIDSPATYPAFA